MHYTHSYTAKRRVKNFANGVEDGVSFITIEGGLCSAPKDKIRATSGKEGLVFDKQTMEVYLPDLGQISEDCFLEIEGVLMKIETLQRDYKKRRLRINLSKAI